MPLDAALRQALQSRGLAFSHLAREAKHRIVVVFSQRPGAFWSVHVDAHPAPSWTADQLDDVLYDLALAQVDAWRLTHG